MSVSVPDKERIRYPRAVENILEYLKERVDDLNYCQVCRSVITNKLRQLDLTGGGLNIALNEVDGELNRLGVWEDWTENGDGRTQVWSVNAEAVRRIE